MSSTLPAKAFSNRYARTAALGAVLVAAVAGGAWVAAPTADEAAVRAALQHYIQGHATGDGAHMRVAFHPAARLFWSSGDTLATRTSEEYVARMPGKPGADEATGVRKRRIEHVDVTGNAAIGKIVLDYPDVYIVDYMSLLKTNGEWKIINKIFMTEMKKK
jgi:Putative lumazine-binding